MDAYAYGGRLMTFLHFALLGGMALGAVPIIIHLLLRRRHKIVRWGAMKYLLEAIEENRKRIQMEDMILLALRVLIVMLVALAVSRPLLRGESVAPGARLAVVLVDNSPSMKAKRGGMSRWDLGRQWAEGLLDRLPRGSAVAVVPMAGSGGGSRGLTQPTREIPVARGVVADLRVSARRADPAAALGMAGKIVRETEDLPSSTVYVVSDFQAADWRGEDGALRRALNDLQSGDRGARVVAVQCSSGETRNTCVTSLSRAGRIIKVGGPARLSGGLRRRAGTGEGAGAAADLGATLEVDGVRVDSRAAKIKAGGSKEVVFYASFETAGDHAVVLRSAPDTSPADDVRYLAVEAREEVRVLVVDGDPRPREDFLSESFYLRFALRPGARALSPIVARVVDPEVF
ncbi:MAG: BatA domain-containing protein, partial [Planctomycetota bacterium]